MKEIRPAVREDLAQIVDLYVRVFGSTHPIPPQELTAYFGKIFFDNPWLEENLPSLVYEEGKKFAIITFKNDEVESKDTNLGTT